jgi:hypothetical protein
MGENLVEVRGGNGEPEEGDSDAGGFAWLQELVSFLMIGSLLLREKHNNLSRR